MQFSSLFTVLLAGFAAAAPSMVERDAASSSVVNAAFDAISSKTSALDTAVKAFTGDLTDVYNASQDIIAEVNSQNTKVKAVSGLTLSEALAVANKADALTKVINTAVDDAIAKKSTFDSADASATVVEVLTQIKNDATTFGATVKSKVPSNAQSIAQGKINNIIAAIQRGITAFS